MNIIQMEIDYCQSEIKYCLKLIKTNKSFRWFNFIFICILSIQAYYFNDANWINGVAIGINIMSIVHIFFSIALNQKEIECNKAKLDLYNCIKNIIEVGNDIRK